MPDRLRTELVALLRGGNAHVPTADALHGVPSNLINQKPASCPHALWDLLEHLRIAQRDILDFTRGDGYEEKDWPADYWPDQPGTAADWTESLAAFHADLDALCQMAEDETLDLTAELAHAPGYTVLRELLLVADHNSHHVGQVVLLRRQLGCWPPPETD
jgi:uncharacterized damage-inducible protein DinB